MTFAGETLPALDAGVGRLPRVRPSVQQQLARRQEGFPASGAEVVFLPSVHLHVSRDASFAEPFPADVAQVGGTVVQAFMLLECIPAQESLVALVTDEYSSSLMKPLVLIKA